MRITFSYGIRYGLAPENFNISDNDIKKQTYYHYKLPLTMDPLKYGKILHHVANIYYIQINPNNSVVIEEKDNMNKIKLFSKGRLIFEWLDKYVNDNTFIREIGTKKYTFKNGELQLVTLEKPNKYINTIKKAKKANDKIITMDIETINVNNKLTPYCICIFDVKIIILII